MNLVLKRAVASILVALMLISGMSTFVFATESEQQYEYYALTLGEEFKAYAPEVDYTVYFSFVPEQTGTYEFTSLSGMDTGGYFYDSQMNEQGFNDNGKNDTQDFSITCALTAGETYYFAAKYYGNVTGELPVIINKVNGVSSIVAEPLDIVENTNGYMDSTYYHYNWYDYIKYTVTFESGDTVTGQGTNFYDEQGKWYYISYSDDQSEQNPWLIDNTYTPTITVMGFSTDVTVNIVESPVASIVAEPFEIYENYSGETRYECSDDGVVNYFSYYWWNSLAFTVYMKDDTVLYGRGTIVNDENDNYYGDISYNDDQSYENAWVKGGTYHPTISFMGCEITLSVSVVGTPVTDVEIEPIEIIENDTGYGGWNEFEIDGEPITYFNYHSWYNKLSFTATLDDGTVLHSEGITLYDENGVNYGNINCNDNQSYENAWVKGETYYPTISFMGYTTTATVSIVDTPVVNIDIEPLEIIEYSENYGSWNETEIDGEPVEYFYYHWYNDLSYTITLNDDTVLYGYGTSVYDENGEYYSYINYYDEQCYENQWVKGGTYTPTISFMGYETTAEVSVVGTPVTDIEIEPIEVIENYDGWYAYEWNEEEQTEENNYFHYSWTDKLSYTITLNDGKVLYGSGTDVYDENNEHYGCISYYDGQGYENQWVKGGTYTPTIMFMGYETTAEVSVVGSPVTEIEIEPIEIIENTDRHYNYEQEYYYYRWNHKVDATITLNNGTKYYIYDSSVWDENYNYVSEFNFDDNQADTNWTVDNTYYPTISFLGYEAEVSVSIVKSPVTSFVVKPIEIIEKTNGNTIFLPEVDGDGEIELYAYHWSELLSYTITLNDGTVFTGTGTQVYDYNGKYYGYINSNDNQEGNPWEKGNTYNPTVSFLGYEITVPVTILESPVESVTFDPITIIENTTGHTEYGWDEEQGEFEWYYYNWDQKLNFTITMKGGATYKGTNGGYYDDDDNYHGVTIFTGQSSVNPWTAGNTYYPEVSFDGYVATVPVTIIEMPIKSISTKPIYLNSQTDYSTNYYYDEDGEHTYNYYEWQQKCVLTVTLSDDSTQTVSGPYFEYLGDQFDIGYDSTQDYYNQWVPGNCYTAYVLLMGSSCPVEIYVMEPQTENGISYLEQADGIIITGIEGEGEAFTVPSTVNGKDVVAISSLGNCGYKEIIIPDSVTAISNDMLDGCTQLEKITLGSGITSISGRIFSYNLKLKEIVIADANNNYCSVDGIVYDTDKTKMVAIPHAKATEHTVPETVTDIEAYLNGSYLFNITLSNSNTGYIKEDGILYNLDKTTVIRCDYNKTGTYTMPETVESIGNNAFLNSRLDKVVISQNVTDIVYCAFMASESLSEVVLPDNLQSIDEYAFRGCTSLSEIALPESLVNLGSAAFANSGLTSVHIPENVEFIGISAFDSTPLENVTFDEGVIGIESSAFKNTLLTSVTLPESLEFIAAYAFYNTPLNSIDFANVQSIMFSAFANTNLTEINIPNTLTYIGEDAFAGSKVKTLNLAEGITQIGMFSFTDMDIESLSFPTTVTEIGYFSFSGCDKLSDIDLPDNLESLDGFAFNGTAWYNSKDDGVVYLENALYKYKGAADENTHIIVKDNTNIISSYAFDSQSGLESIYLTDSVKNIGYGAFAYCGGLTDVYFTGSEDDFENIEIGQCNEWLTHANWHFNYVCTHKYTDACDAECDICAATRIAPHSYEFDTTKATLSKDGSIDYKCEGCGDIKSSTAIYRPSTFTLSEKSYTYDGKVKSPSVVVKDTQGNTLVEDTDYTLTYESGRKNVGTYDVTVKMKGNYSGSKTLSFTIKPIDISTCSVSLSAKSYTYDGKVKEPSVTVKNAKGTTLSEGTHYTVTYESGRKNVGTYDVTVKMKGNYSGSKTLSFTIKPIDISTCSVSLSAKSYTYDGKVKTPGVTVKNAKGTTLSEGTHYTVTYESGRKNVGTYDVTVKMKGNYSGSKTLSFTIKPIDISTCSVSLSAKSYTYDGKVKTPGVTVKNAKGTTLSEGTHYTVTYESGRKNVGTYDVTVKMKGNYSGSKTLSFTIKPIDISVCSVSLSAKSYTYDGKVKEPSVTVKNAKGTKLSKGTHYTVTYESGRKNVGTYDVTVKMKGNYGGSKTLTFKINPVKTTVSKLTAGKKSITVNITKKSTQVTGYEVQYSTSSKFTNAKTKTITSYKTTKTTLSSLSAKKTYYVRVRTYKTVGSTKYYSAWSSSKYVKTK